ncbi:glycerol-3-phosphate responsive antiterminator [Rossellomorea sp. BNER]|uniref:glycerol-3-phosphate responsive antiterminator n=1 Tax=Rossellomorea sp. BNER TaxID=2962031 RepID=UPI003AF2088A|nr:glycerol-3-phosphate responsive antiterminator [Rossellomorea sp. BNER]
MSFNGQKILPAVRNMKDFDKMMDTQYLYGVFLDLHVGQLKSVYQYANRAGKNMFLHIDLIQGLKSDEFATEYVCQEVKPYGIISTKGSVIQKANQKGVATTLRTFIIDSSALKKSINLIQKVDPDYIEVLPGVVPKVIKEIHEATGKPIFAGGLIESVEEVEVALDAGASAITTSNRSLWNQYNLPRINGQ